MTEYELSLAGLRSTMSGYADAAAAAAGADAELIAATRELIDVRRYGRMMDHHIRNSSRGRFGRP